MLDFGFQNNSWPEVNKLPVWPEVRVSGPIRELPSSLLSISKKKTTTTSTTIIYFLAKEVSKEHSCASIYWSNDSKDVDNNQQSYVSHLIRKKIMYTRYPFLNSKIDFNMEALSISCRNKHWSKYFHRILISSTGYLTICPAVVVQAALESRAASTTMVRHIVR